MDNDQSQENRTGMRLEPAFNAAETAKALDGEMTLALARIEALDRAEVITSEDMRIHISV